MQFLVYLTVLMVSVSTVLLEIHWLTTPARQPKTVVQASAAPPPKVEGPNAELSPIYPRKVEPVQPAPTQNNVQSNVSPAGTGSTMAKAETTGAAARSDDLSTTKRPVPPDNAQAYAAQPKQIQADEAAESGNRCDVQACASAYKSFRASDTSRSKVPAACAGRHQNSGPTASKETSRNVDPGAVVRIHVTWIEERDGGSMTRTTRIWTT